MASTFRRWYGQRTGLLATPYRSAPNGWLHAWYCPRSGNTIKMAANPFQAVVQYTSMNKHPHYPIPSSPNAKPIYVGLVSRTMNDLDPEGSSW